MAIPTRTQIANKIDNLIADPTKNREDFYGAISSWLDGQSCPTEDKEKILDDLESYPNY